jgi:hypothetical protein
VNRIERYLDQLIGGLNDMVERALQKHRLNPKTLDSNESTRKTDANWHQALEPGISIWGEQAIPPCPICGVNPHNWGIHEEWRHLPGAKSKEKLAAQTEKRTQRTRLQSYSRGQSPRTKKADFRGLLPSSPSDSRGDESAPFGLHSCRVAGNNVY